MPPAQDPATPTGRAAVLDLVKREGPVSAEAIAARLGITAMAVRQHLYGLANSGLVANETRASARGRPAKLWRVTAGADVHFADSHALLAGDLIVQMKKAFGDEGLDRLLKLRTAEQAKAYRAAAGAKTTLKARLDVLAAIRNREGYMAEVRRDANTGGWLFVENHCPICAAATLCTGLCREELVLFGKVLGRDVRVERLLHILEGAGRCAYRITSLS